MHPVDLTKLRTYLRHQSSDSIFELLDRALDELTPEGLARVMQDFVDLNKMRSVVAAPPSLADEVAAFHGAAVCGDYYESFNVNSRNFSQMSNGTSAFHATFSRLLRRCLETPLAGNEAGIRHALELLFDLVRRIDECNDDIVFYADEGGSWQLGVQWPEVFEVWCPCLSATAQADEYSTAAEKLVKEFVTYDKDAQKVRKIAKKWAKAG